MEGNREFRSDVFSMLMEDRRNALQVYNALNNTEYDDPELVEVRTLDKGVSLSVRNDAAIVVDSVLSLYEHQSTVCPNMPLRQLFYVSNTLRKIVKNENLFGSSLVKIPVPKFVVFYNGEAKQPAVQELRLSDAFEKKTERPELELFCKVYNINPGMNDELLSRCRVLDEYMIFVNYVREYRKKYGNDELKTAIEVAIERCIKEDILVEFFRKRREEVMKAMELDFTFERQIELESAAAMKRGEARGIELGREQGRKQGEAIGEARGREQGIEVFILDKIEDGIPEEKIVAKLMKAYSLDEEKAMQYLEKYGSISV